MPSVRPARALPGAPFRLVVALVGVVSHGLPADAHANPCIVGARVGVEDVGEGGTITELGTQHPHAGWYRVAFDWNVRGGNPLGEWYDPTMRRVQVAGTTAPCPRSDASPVTTPAPTPPAATTPAQPPVTPPAAAPVKRPTPTAAPEPGTCAVGARVSVEEVGEGGTITEIGTQVPHVGWYRVAFEWNLRSGNTQGEWYDPKLRHIRVADTDVSCGRAPSAPRLTPDPPTLSPGHVTPAAATQPVPPDAVRAAPPADASCATAEPPGTVSRARASAALFQRVIYEQFAATLEPKRIGLTFLDFELGRPYRNELTGEKFEDPRMHDGAPEGAMIHPVRARFVKCDLFDHAINRYVVQQEFACFQDGFDEWVCPSSGAAKYIERGEVPLR